KLPDASFQFRHRLFEIEKSNHTFVYCPTGHTVPRHASLAFYPCQLAAFGGRMPADGRYAPAPAGALSAHGYRSGWWKYRRGPASSAPPAGPRHGPEDGWQRH